MSNLRPHRRGLIGLIVGLMLIGCAGQPVSAKSRLEPLSIISASGRAEFQVEVVDNDRTREQGLMYRKALAPDRGMLFDFKRPREVAFWMKNTFIPLDLIFIRADGRVLSIARNARPFDETPLASGGPILGVLEIPGGRAAELGVLPGDRVLHRIFPRG